MRSRMAWVLGLAVGILCLISSPTLADYSVKFTVFGSIGPTHQDRWCAQLDSDPALEFVVVHTHTAGALSIFDGSSGATEFSASFQTQEEPTSSGCTILDVDGDGLLEVLVRATFQSDSQTLVIDTDGPVSVSEVAPAAPSAVLGQNAPNPFNPATNITFELPQAGAVDLRIYNTTGQLVKTLAKGPFDAGTHVVRWDGRDDEGGALSSGVYYYEIVTASGRQSKKAVLLK